MIHNKNIQHSAAHITAIVVMSKALVWLCCRLLAQQKEWLALQAELLAQGSVLRGELSASQLERMRLEGELSTLRETNQSLDLSNARLTSQYQVLTRCTHTHTQKCIYTSATTQRCFVFKMPVNHLYAKKGFSASQWRHSGILPSRQKKVFKALAGNETIFIRT